MMSLHQNVSVFHFQTARYPNMKLLPIITQLPSILCLSQLQASILVSLFEHFEPDYLDIIHEGLSPPMNDSFPAKNFIMTSLMTPEKLISALTWESSRTSLIAAEANTGPWTKFTKMTKTWILRRAKWVLFKNTPLSSALEGLLIPFDCQFLVVDLTGSLAILTEVYHIGPGEELTTVHFGFWSPDDGLHPPKTYFYQRRPNFQGYTFTAVIKNMPPYTYVVEGKNGTVVISGYFYEVWKELEFRLKFQTIYKILGAGERIMQEIRKDDFTFSVSPVVQDSKTIAVAGLTEPIYEPKIHLFGRRPGSELKWNSYLKPFSTDTWLTMLCWLLGSAFTFSVMYFFAWKYTAAESQSGYYVFPFSVCLETTFRAICGQGSDVMPRSLSCRLFFLSIYMTALVVTSAFSAALFSLLTVPVSREPFSNFKQVYENKNFKLGIVPDTDVYEGIKDLSERLPNSDRSKLFQMLEPSTKLPGRVEQALEQVCHRTDYIFMWDLPNVQLRMQNLTRICQERIMPGGPMVFNEHLGFATSKGSPYKRLIDLHLVRMKNEGVLKRLLTITWPPRIPNVQTTWVRVTVDDISPILYMFALGVVLGVVILMVERILAGTKRTKKGF